MPLPTVLTRADVPLPTVFTRADAIAAGHSPAAISRRVARGAWTRLLPQVYASAEPSFDDLVRAATLWCPHGVVSHLAAAWLWRVADAPPAVLHVTVPKDSGRRSPATWLRVVRRRPTDVCEVGGVAVVSAERAVLDAVAVLDDGAAARLVDRDHDHRSWRRGSARVNVSCHER